MRRGHRLHLTAHGPGTATADRTFLFGTASATVTLAADPGHYLYSLMLDGVPQPGVYDYATENRILTFDDVTQDHYLDAWFTIKLWTLNVVSLITPHRRRQAHTPSRMHGHHRVDR